jgi:hypothetical protein
MGTGLGSAAVTAPSPGGKDGKRREYMVGFAVSSASPALAALVTNPIEVVKVRQQITDTNTYLASKDTPCRADLYTRLPVERVHTQSASMYEPKHRCGSRQAAPWTCTPAEAWRAR